MSETRYLIEHKPTGQWMTVFDGLTNDPNDKSLWWSSSREASEDMLLQMQRVFHSDFAGNVFRADLGRDMMMSLQRAWKEKMQSLGLDFNDLVTEHEYISP